MPAADAADTEPRIALPAHRLLAKRLRARRVEIGLTRELLAIWAEVPSSTIKRFERFGLIGLESFTRLVIALGRDDELARLFLPRRRPDSPRVLLRRMKFRRRGRAGTEEAPPPR